MGMSKLQYQAYTSQAGQGIDNLKGTVEQKQNPITKEVGEDHPFDYEIPKGIYLSFSFMTGVVDKIVDYLWGPGFYTKSADPRAKELIDIWVETVRFKLHGREWVKQAVIKGFSPMELAGSKAQVPGKVRTLNANRVYVKRNAQGEVLGYNQIKANAKTYSKDNLIPFEPFQIAALHVNRIDDDPYGYGMIWTQRKTIGALIDVDKDMHKLVKRKANTPIVVYMGNAATNEIPTAEATAEMADKLTFMNNQTEWVFSQDMKAEVLDFGDPGKKFETVIEHDKQMLRYGTQVPQVLMGDGNIAEGLAGEQGEAFDRFIQSLRINVEAVIEDEIFTRVLKAQNMSAKVEFIWGEMSKSEKNTLITQITMLLNNAMIGNKFRMELEKKLAGCFDIEEAAIEDDAAEREKEMNQPQAPVPGSNQPGRNQSVVQLEFVEGALEL